MSLPRVHLLMPSEVASHVVPLATHVARVPEHVLVNRLLMCFHVLRPRGAKTTAVVWASDLSSLVLRARVAAEFAGSRRPVAASLDGTDEAPTVLVNNLDVNPQTAFV